MDFTELLQRMYDIALTLIEFGQDVFHGVTTPVYQLALEVSTEVDIPDFVLNFLRDSVIGEMNFLGFLASGFVIFMIVAIAKWVLDIFA